ncbi:hypothetical protein PO124_17800 [Bacillus licheniformis]|nr:hypothetical protein [Bacillus licheniformis]
MRKYSDLILWKEVLRFAKEKQRNIILLQMMQRQIGGIAK